MRAVTILVPCLNEVGFIDACIQSIIAQEGLTQDSEVLVLDGMSTDGTRERVVDWSAKDPRVRLIDNLAGYVSPGLNMGIAVAKNEIILRFDAHTEYAPDYICACVRTLLDTGAENVGGPARTKANSYTQHAIRLAYHDRRVVGGARFHDVDYEGPVDTVAYGCWYKTVLESAGMFDETLVRNQDDELNFRIRKMGGIVWQSPKIRSWYWPRASISALARQYYQYGYWKVWVIKKHGRAASLRHYVPGLFVVLCVLLCLLSLPLKSARVILLIFLSAYFLFAIGVSVSIAAKSSGWRYLPVLPTVIAAFQLPYGAGFMIGIFDHVAGSGRRSSASTSTR